MKNRNKFALNRLPLIVSIVTLTSGFVLCSFPEQVSAQFSCDDVKLGEDTREIRTPDGMKLGTATITGMNCRDANHYQYQDNYDQRVLERNQSRDRQVTEVMNGMSNNQSEIMRQHSETKNQLIQNLFGGNNEPSFDKSGRRCGRFGMNNPGDCE